MSLRAGRHEDIQCRRSKGSKGKKRVSARTAESKTVVTAARRVSTRIAKGRAEQEKEGEYSHRVDLARVKRGRGQFAGDRVWNEEDEPRRPDREPAEHQPPPLCRVHALEWSRAAELRDEEQSEMSRSARKQQSEFEQEGRGWPDFRRSRAGQLCSAVASTGPEFLRVREAGRKQRWLDCGWTRRGEREAGANGELAGGLVAPTPEAARVPLACLPMRWSRETVESKCDEAGWVAGRQAAFA